MSNTATTALYAFRKFGNLVLKTAYCYTANYIEAEDIAQDVFLTLHEKNISFNDEEHLKAWLLRVTINRGKNYSKSWKQKGRVDIDELPEQAEYDMSARDRELKDAVFSLPPKYSTVLYLYYYEDHTIKEIASLLQKSENTIGSLLRRGREKLKLELEEYTYDTQRI